jgi:hypothetical protein
MRRIDAYSVSSKRLSSGCGGGSVTWRRAEDLLPVERSFIFNLSVRRWPFA